MHRRALAVLRLAGGRIAQIFSVGGQVDFRNILNVRILIRAPIYTGCRIYIPMSRAELIKRLESLPDDIIDAAIVSCLAQTAPPRPSLIGIA